MIRLLALAVILLAGTAHAQALDQGATAALDDTVAALHQQGGAHGSVPGVAPDSELGRALEASPELRQELYDLAGDAMRDVTAQGGGDAGKMNGLVERGQTDPAAFADALSPQTRDRMRALAAKIETRRQPRP